MATLDSNKKRIVSAMKGAGIYSGQLTVQIDALAAQLTAMQKAAVIIDALDDICLCNTTGHGETHVVHPAFKVLKDSTDQITRMCKQLNLTVADIVGKPEQRTPIDDLTEEILNIE